MSTTPFEVKAPGYVARVHDSFALQGAMQTLGARLGLVAPGAVNIELDWAAGLTQQHGFCTRAWWPPPSIQPVATPD